MNKTAAIATILNLCWLIPLMVALGRVGIVGMLFDLLIIGLFLPFFYLWFLGRKRQKVEELEKEETRRHSTPISAWKGSTATLIERPNQPVKIDMQVSPRFCPHLVKLSSLMVKCPKCQHVFPRFFSKLCTELSPSEYQSLKSGELSMTEILTRQIRKVGCPSTFCCPKCNTTIIRSREPSAICQLYGKRVHGEKLFCCTISQCIGSLAHDSLTLLPL